MSLLEPSMGGSNGLSGLEAFVKEHRTCGEHEALPDILDQALVDVVRDELESDPELKSNSEVTDEEILDVYDWSGAPKRRKKWMWMAGDYILRSKDVPRDRYNECACAVAIYMDSLNNSETVKSALARETFEADTSIEVPRSVLENVLDRVQDRDDLTIEDILKKHRKAVSAENAPIEVSQ